jgi:ATP-dependent Clp protease ATP-binding subunit ClpA
MTISKELEATIQAAAAEAKKRRHEFITLEHVLYALLSNKSAHEVLVACGCNFAKLRKDLDQFFDDTIEQLPERNDADPQQTAAFWRTLQRAAMHVASSGKEYVDGANVLASMFREQESHAVYLLQQQGITRLDVTKYISHGISKNDPKEEPAIGAEEEGGESTDPLGAYTVNLNERALAGKIDPLIGRTHEVERAIHVLARRRKNNPILVGDPGVGKTAIVEGIALAITEKKVPKHLYDAVIYSLDMGALLAGTKFRGQFEERLKGVMKAIKDRPEAILFIDEIHTIVGAGATSGGSMDASNLLKPALANGDIRCIGSTTHSEFKAAFDRDRALARRFQRIDILEPSIEETILILKGLKSVYEKHHDVVYSDEALEVAARLSAKHIQDRHLPDKAIDVIDEAGAADRLKPEGERVRNIGRVQIETTVSKIAKVPVAAVTANDQDALQKLEPELKRAIYGQDAAIAALASAIKLSRSGLGHIDRPIGSFLFSGPTGVGKTELAKQLAKTLGVEFLRYDMTEYMEKHTVSRLIGAPPGYVGFDQGGLLTDAIRKTPYAVVVLDEIEKAHPDVYNILLQVMDHATLTDNNGRKADFKHVILIMTTNAGAREMAAKAIGFGGANSAKQSSRSKEAIERAFSPEFRNRLDGWIAFDSLPAEIIVRVVRKFIGELRAQLVEKLVDLNVEDSAVEWLAEHGFDAQFGARPMGRIIANEIKKPLADEIIFGKLKHGGRVKVSAKDDKLILDYDVIAAEHPALN